MHLTEHEALEAQEHIRTEATTMHMCNMLAQQCQDPELRQFMQREVQVAQQNVQKLLSILNNTTYQQM